MERRSVLGRGLKALIPDSNARTLKDIVVIELPLADIMPNEDQPRHDFNDDKLDDLMNSIKEKGIMQPILVRQKGYKYEIIAGERRYRACKGLGFEKMPAIIRNVSDEESLELALIENIQREDLNLIETALGYKRLIEDFNLTHQDVSKKIGKDRSSITNTVRLLTLPDIVQDAVKTGVVSFGHAKVILSLETQQEQITMCQKIMSDSLTVKDTEIHVKKILRDKKPKEEQRDPDILSMEERLQTRFGTKVKIEHNQKKQKGFLKIEYYSNDDLNRILDLVK